MPINKYSNVYVPQQYQTPFDLSMYGQVMQQKQMRFETTFSAMQSSLDAIAENTDIARLPEREYFQSVLQKTTDAINKYGSQDLGNTQIQSKVMGLARSIGQNNIINTARINTAAMRKQDAAAEEAKKKGKWADANQHVYDKAKNAYLDPNDKSLGKSFDGQWEDYFDMGKLVMDVGKVMKTDKKLSYPESFPGYAAVVLPTAPNASGLQKAASGKEVVEASTAIQQRIVTTESLDENKVIAVLRSAINNDPRAARQLQINAEYYADNTTNDDLKKQYKTQMGSEYAEYKKYASEMEGLETNWTQHGDPKMAAYYKDYKEKYQAKAKELEGKLDPKNDAALNEEVKNKRYAIAGDIYGTDFARGYAKAFTVDRESVQVITNMENFAKLQHEFKVRELLAKNSGKIAPSAVVSHMPEIPKNQDALTTITKTADIVMKNREAIKSGMGGVSAQFKADYQGTEFPVKAVEKPFEFYNDLLEKTKKGGKLTMEEERYLKDGQKWAIQEYENSVIMADINKVYVESGLQGASNARDKLATNIQPVSWERPDGSKSELSSEDQRALADISMNPDQHVEYKTKTIIDSKGDNFTFNYMSVKGDTDFGKRFNARQEERVNKFLTEVGKKNIADWRLLPFTGQLIKEAVNDAGIIQELPNKAPSGFDKSATSHDNFNYLNKRYADSKQVAGPNNPGAHAYINGSLGLESVEKNVSNQVLEGYNISRGPGTSVFSEKAEFQDILKPIAENYQRNWGTGDSYNETEGIAADDQILNVIGVSKGKREGLDVGVIYVNVKTGTNKEMSKAIVVDSGGMANDPIFGSLKTNPYFETEGFLQGGYAAMKKRDPKAVYYNTTQTNSPYTISTNRMKNVRLQYHVAGETYYASYQRPDGSWEKLPVGHANLVHLNEYVAAYVEQAK